MPASAWHRAKALILSEDLQLRRIWSGANRGCKMAFRGTDLRARFGLYEPIVSWALRVLHFPGAGCLDVGCGYGYHLLTMAQLSEGVHGIDQSPTRAMWAERACEASGLHYAKTTRATVDALPSWPSLVKIDVDGTEAQILEASLDQLEAQGPRLVIETHSPELLADCRWLLGHEAGYQELWYCPAKNSDIGRGWLAAFGHPAEWTQDETTPPAGTFRVHPAWDPIERWVR